MLSTVVLDVGETLVDETGHWARWADWLGVPAFTLSAVIGGLAARGLDHRLCVQIVRPDTDFQREQVAMDRCCSPPPARLYDDARPCLAALRSDGWRVVVAGNSTRSFQRTVEQLDLPVDLVTFSAELGACKPTADFYERVAVAAGVPAADCVHVGDRVDNDLFGAAAAGMRVVHLRRGPWGLLHDAPPGVPVLTALSDLPGLLRELR